MKDKHDMTKCPNCENCIRDLRTENGHLRKNYDKVNGMYVEAANQRDKFREALQKVANWHYSTGAKDVAKYALEEAGITTDTTKGENR